VREQVGFTKLDERFLVPVSLMKSVSFLVASRGFLALDARLRHRASIHQRRAED
jgi:hypothetical protein